MVGATVRTAVFELKAAKSCLVSELDEGTLSWIPGQPPRPLTGMTHLTVHRNLMVHVKGTTTSSEILDSPIRDGQLNAPAVHLCSMSPAPKAQPDRYQSSWSGGTAIISLVRDDLFVLGTTRLLVDLWATMREFQTAHQLPPIAPNCRPAVSRSAPNYLGPIDAAWAFPRGEPPPCHFHLRFWFTEPGPPGVSPFLIPGGQTLSGITQI